ncbi:MAG: purine-nucleoside phosphorylase [Acidimicrobiia bacterium]|nr:purine-nucleoside phosphorylase [Acidimicrobiia bacterium]
MDELVPLLEFDPAPTALIEPSEVFARRPRIPEVAVLCFFAEVIEALAASPETRVIGSLRAAHGAHEIYGIRRHGQDVAVFHPGVGAPLAAAFLEEAIALGARRVVACGGAGAVVPELALGQVVVPTAAVRDEGTSFHYLAPGRQVEAGPGGVATAQRVLQEADVAHQLGLTWTTDGIFRETRDRIARRRAEGCVTVEMEAAAFFAVARFRGIAFAQLLYAGDDVSGERWAHRRWHRSPSRQLTFDLAVDVALALEAAGVDAAGGQ